MLDFPTSLQTQGNCLTISILISLGLYILLPRGIRSAVATMYGNAPTYTTQLINNLTSSYRAPGFDTASYPSYNQVCPFFSCHISSFLIISRHIICELISSSQTRWTTRAIILPANLQKCHPTKNSLRHTSPTRAWEPGLLQRSSSLAARTTSKSTFLHVSLFIPGWHNLWDYR